MTEIPEHLRKRAEEAHAKAAAAAGARRRAASQRPRPTRPPAAAATHPRQRRCRHERRGVADPGPPARAQQGGREAKSEGEPAEVAVPAGVAAATTAVRDRAHRPSRPARVATPSDC